MADINRNKYRDGVYTESHKNAPPGESGSLFAKQVVDGKPVKYGRSTPRTDLRPYAKGRKDS